jgi:hypothetical protein
MFYSNPDCQTQREDLPCSAQYPGYLRERRGVVAGDIAAAYVGTRQDVLR